MVLDVVAFLTLPVMALRADDAVAFVPVGFRTTVVVLLWLVSLALLKRRPTRVGGRDGWFRAVVAGRVLLLIAVAGRDVVVAVAFLDPPARAAFAFSTMLVRALIAVAERDWPLPLSGDPGLLRGAFLGEVSR